MVIISKAPLNEFSAKHIGAHKDYDKIDASEITFKK